MKSPMALFLLALCAMSGAQAKNFYKGIDLSDPGFNLAQTCAGIGACTNGNPCVDLVDPSTSAIVAVDCTGVGASEEANVFGDNSQFCNLHFAGFSIASFGTAKILSFTLFFIYVAIALWAGMKWFNRRLESNVVGRSSISDHLQTITAWQAADKGPNAYQVPRKLLVHAGNTWKAPLLERWTKSAVGMALSFILFQQFIMTPYPFTNQDRTLLSLDGGDSWTHCKAFGGVAIFGLTLLYASINALTAEYHDIQAYGEHVISLRKDYLAERQLSSRDKIKIHPRDRLTSADTFGTFIDSWTGGWIMRIFDKLSGLILLFGFFAIIHFRVQGNRSCCDLALSTDSESGIFTAILAGFFLMQALVILGILLNLWRGFCTTRILARNGNETVLSANVKAALMRGLAWRYFHDEHQGAQNGVIAVLFACFATSAYTGAWMAIDSANYSAENESFDHYPWLMHNMIVVSFVWFAIHGIRTWVFTSNADAHMSGSTELEYSEEAAAKDIRKYANDRKTQQENFDKVVEGQNTAAERITTAGGRVADFKPLAQFKSDWLKLAKFHDQTGAMRTNMTGVHAMHRILLNSEISNAERSVANLHESVDRYLKSDQFQADKLKAAAARENADAAPDRSY